MSRPTFGILSTFDHNVQSWETFKGRIVQYFIANDIDEDTDATGKKRKAILLSALTEGTYKLALDLALPKNIDVVPYNDIIILLDSHFTPKTVGFGDRHKFYAATQQVGESHSQWAARLRGLTARCGFLNVEEALRDRFIMGMRPGHEKEKLYSQDVMNLNLAKVTEIAENLNCARASAVVGGTADHVVDTVNQVYKMDKTLKTHKKIQCSACGYTNHKVADCKFASYNCKKCNKRGHLRKMCPDVNYVVMDCSGQGEDSEGDDGKLFHIRSLRGEPMVETVLINSMPIKFEIDSGSTVSVISENFYIKRFKGVPLSITNRKLMSYNGRHIECAGYMRVSVCYAGQSHTIDFYVVKDGGPPLLGRDFIAKFKLQLLPINYYCSELLNDISNYSTSNFTNDLHQKYPQLFSNELGTFNKYTVNLMLKENAKPIFIKARPVAFALKDKVAAELDRLTRLGILKPVRHSEYASPIVPVLKRDGSVRLCADYSVTINKQLLVDQYALPTINELFSKIYGGKIFSKIDLSMAYNQLCLSEESQKLTCINTHRGLYNFTRLVFGLSNAPSIFQRAIEGVLSGLEGVVCLLDDVLVYSGDNYQEHLEKLRTVLGKLQDAGLTLHKDKCSFFKDEISYLGYTVSKDGLKKSPEKVTAMVNAPVPTNVHQLQSFLGLINYYRNFVPNASTILSPLYDLLKKGCKWNWQTEHQSAFETIKHILTSDQVLAHFNPNSKLILTVDASPNGLGAILSQVDTDGVERPISFASRTLNSAEKRYAQIQKEATAIIYGVRRFHQYLYGRTVPFILRTDHKPLLSIFGPYKGIPEMSANRLQRYALFLSSYNYVIEYIRSEHNSADYLSRASLPGAETTGTRPTDPRAPPPRCACTEHEPVIGCDRATYVCFVIDGSMPVTLDRLRDETNKDAILRKICTFIRNGWPAKCNDIFLKPYFICKNELSVESGCVMRGHKIVLPESLHQIILKELHSSHLGIVKTKAEARSRFWFPDIDKALENMIASCDVCNQLRPSPPRAPLVPWSVPRSRFSRIHIDFLGPIRNCTYLVIVDAYTKWVEVYNMNNTTTSAAVKNRLCDYIARFGLPETVVSDNGTAFCSQELETFFQLNGIAHLTSPVYHPASNGQAESFVKIIKKGIKSSLMSSNNAKEAANKLLRYLMDYRNSVHTTTGFTPSQMVFGKKLRSRLDLISPKPSSPPPLASSNGQEKFQCIQFKKNDLIMYKRYINKIKFTWCKGIIVRRLGKVLYEIKDGSNVFKRHKNQLRLYKGTSNECNREVDTLSAFGDLPLVAASPPPPPWPPSPPAQSSPPSLRTPPPPLTPSLQTPPQHNITTSTTRHSDPHTSGSESLTVIDLDETLSPRSVDTLSSEEFASPITHGEPCQDRRKEIYVPEDSMSQSSRSKEGESNETTGSVNYTHTE